MPRNNFLPQFPYDYLGAKAEEYNELQWMERNQKKTTLECVEYLFDQKLGSTDIKDFSNYLILDLGCGTGFSTEVLVDLGFNVIAIDLLMDMLEKAYHKKELFSDINVLELILANMVNLPFKPSIFHYIISVSAYNFITYKKITQSEIKKTLDYTANYLNKCLKKNGRIVIEFYPHSQEELDLFVSSFTGNKFHGYFIKNNPHQKGGKTFLLLKKVDNI